MVAECIYIMCGGAHIHNTYYTVIEEIRPTHVCVIVEKQIDDIIPITPSMDEKAKDAAKRTMKNRKYIREAIITLKKYTSTGKKRIFKEYPIIDQSTDSVKKAVLDIKMEHPTAELWFNVTSGTTLLSVSLFLAALWVEGKICITPSDDDFIRFRVPKMHLEDLSKKKNYADILNILYEYDTRASTLEERGMNVTELYHKIDGIYEAMVIDALGKRKNNPSRKTKWLLMQQLEEWGLIERKFKGKKQRFTITEDGEYSLKMLQLQKSDENK